MKIKRHNAAIIHLHCFAGTTLFLIFSTEKIPLYRASSQVLLQINLPEANRLLKKKTRYNKRFFLPTQLGLLKSFNVIRRVVDQLDLAGQYKNHFIQNKLGDKPFQKQERDTHNTLLADGIAKQIQRRIQIHQIKKTMIINIAYSHKTPFIAQMVINALPNAYTEELRAMNTDLSNNSLQWMTVKIQEEQNKLEELEKKIQGFMQKHNIIAVEGKLAIYPARLAKFSRDLSQARTQEKEFQAIYRQIERAGKKYQALESISLLAENTLLQELRSQIFLLEQEIRALKKKYGPKHPVLVKAEAEQKQLTKKKHLEIERVIAAYKNNYELAQIKVKDLDEFTQATKDELLAMNEQFARYTALNQEKRRNKGVETKCYFKRKIKNISTLPGNR